MDELATVYGKAITRNTSLNRQYSSNEIQISYVYFP